VSNLTSTVPGAFNALYDLLNTAGAAQSTPIPIFHSEVLEGEATLNGYVLLGGVERHNFDPAALGSYAFYETYDIVGCVVFYQGGADPLSLVEQVLTTTWGIYQNVVMTTLVANRGANGTQVLGAAAPAALEWCIPVEASYSGGQGDVGGASGWQGVVDFRYNVKARLTTA
jgi:hypothetical protein